MRSEIWEEFQRHGITIPYPIRTLEIEPRARTLEIARPRRRELAGEGQAPPPARLFVYRGVDAGRSLDLHGAVTVGRSSACTLPLAEPRASKEHLRLEPREEGWVATDLGSQNGTLVNGRPLDSRVLCHLDHLTLGDTVIIFEGDT